MKVPLGKLAIAVAATLLMLGRAGTADAASAKPKVKYAFTTIYTCEAQFAFTTQSVRLANNKTDTGVRIIESQHNGHIGSGVGYITFTPKSASGGNYDMSLTDIGGGALRIVADGKPQGINVSTKPQSSSGTYSFTATTFTINPQGGDPMTFTMAYGEPDPSTGITKSVHLVRQDSNSETNNCVMAITATK
jgi:hypothetical protein